MTSAPRQQRDLDATVDDGSDGALASSRASAGELRKEAYTMALYVSVCLLAALTAAADNPDDSDPYVLGIVWGTTIGLALAHWFAFRVSARLVSAGTVHRADVEISFALLAGAIAVAGLATVPVLVLSGPAQLDAVRLLLAGFIGTVGYLTVRGGGAPRHRAVVYAAGVLVAALVIALVKNVLIEH